MPTRQTDAAARQQDGYCCTAVARAALSRYQRHGKVQLIQLHTPTYFKISEHLAWFEAVGKGGNSTKQHVQRRVW